MAEVPQSPLSIADLKTWRRLARSTSLLFAELDRQMREELGMSGDDFGVLAALYSSPERSMRMADLAEASTFSPSRLSHAASRMEKRGWVERTPSEEDSRGRIAMLTDEGALALEDAWPSHAALINELVFSSFDRSDRRTVERFLSGIADAIHERRASES